jgi:hypothetical protein
VTLLIHFEQHAQRRLKSYPTPESSMRGMPYTKASRQNDDQIPTNSFVSEALAKQAANRPVKKPAKELVADQTLPKVGRAGRRRRPR